MVIEGVKRCFDEKLDILFTNKTNILKKTLNFCSVALDFLFLNLWVRFLSIIFLAEEEASRALKTLRSSKAPLVKKRQVMRTMAGDYRKKMEEEKNKQFKLIQSGECFWPSSSSWYKRPSLSVRCFSFPSELASAQVQAVSVVPKKSTFHRRAEANQKHGDVQDTNARVQTQDGASTFVFSASKQEFRFNFL